MGSAFLGDPGPRPGGGVGGSVAVTESRSSSGTDSRSGSGTDSRKKNRAREGAPENPGAAQARARGGPGVVAAGAR